MNRGQVLDAFRKKAREGHADNGGTADMDELTKAKELLLSALTIPLKDEPAGSSNTCGFCGGRGSYSNGRFGVLICPACNGTGER